MATAQTTVGGNENLVYTIGSIGGGLHVGNQYSFLDSNFFEPNLREFAREEWIDPPDAFFLVETLAREHLLVLGGEFDELTECALHLAHNLEERLSTQNKKLQVRQRSASNEPQRLESALQGERPILLLLVEATPTSIAGFQSIAELRRLLRSAESYAIVTTRRGRGEWSVAEGSLDAQLWHELRWDHYYGVTLLTEFLRERLQREPASLPPGILPAGPEGDDLIAELPLSTVAERLRAPGKIKELASWLANSPGPVGRDSIEERIALLEGQEVAVDRWFRQFGPRDRLLVLALTLFEGLTEDLLFTGLEKLVGSTWRAADPLLTQFDYQDLTRFSAYFHRAPVAGGSSRIECRPPARRQQLLELSWRDQRRRLLEALPVLTELIRTSADRTLEGVPETPAPPVGEPEAKPAAPGDGTVRFSRRDASELHGVLVESLGLVSRLSFDVVQPYFLDLAVDPSESVRRFVARALSSWWATGNRAALLQLLRDWWEAAVDYEHADPRLDRLGPLNRDPRSALRAVIALIVGYATRHERPNHMSQELYHLFAVLVEDADPVVRKALRPTVSVVVAWHLRQIEPLIRSKLLFANDLVSVVAEGVGEACSMRPEEGFLVLDAWRTAAKGERWSSPLPRERLLAAVALAHGFIRCDDLRPQLKPEILGARLHSLLAEETSPYVRRCIFFAVELQVVKNLSLLSLVLKDLLSGLSIADRPAAVEIFVRTYLHQRLRLQGGDDRMSLASGSFALWVTSPRPLTEIESTLYGWLLDTSSPVAQQLAVDVFEALAETAIERTEEERRRGQPGVSAFAGETRLAPNGEALVQTYPLPLLGRLAVYLAAPKKPGVQETLGPLLAELIQVEGRRTGLRSSFTSPVLRPEASGPRPQRGRALIERFRGVSNEATRAMAQHLDRALSIYRWRFVLVAAALWMAGSLSLGLWWVYGQVTRPRPVPPFSQEVPQYAPGQRP